MELGWRRRVNVNIAIAVKLFRASHQFNFPWTWATFSCCRQKWNSICHRPTFWTLNTDWVSLSIRSGHERQLLINFCVLRTVSIHCCSSTDKKKSFIFAQDQLLCVLKRGADLHTWKNIATRHPERFINLKSSMSAFACTSSLWRPRNNLLITPRTVICN